MEKVEREYFKKFFILNLKSNLLSYFSTLIALNKKESELAKDINKDIDDIIEYINKKSEKYIMEKKEC